MTKTTEHFIPSDELIGTSINTLKQHNAQTNLNHNSIRQMQDIMARKQDNAYENMTEFAENLNQDLEDIDNYTPEDIQQIRQIQQIQHLNQLEQQKQLEEMREKINIVNQKKSKYPDFVIEMIILIIIYMLLSSGKTQNIIASYSGINLRENVKIIGVLIYGIILTIIFMITKTVILKIKNKFN